MKKMASTRRVLTAIALFAGVAGCTSVLGDFSSGSGADDAGMSDATTSDASSDGAGDVGPAADSGAPPADAAADQIAACTSGALCSPGACQTGTQTCDGGATTCKPGAPAMNGTLCDASAVCDNGVCTTCASGADCSEAGTCQVAKIACGTGSPVCSAAGNAPNGSSCGANLYCANGACAPCTNDAPCVPAANPCHVGSASCADGGITCNDQNQNASDGTSCGTNEVCLAGACVACIAGLACNPAGNVCQTGTTSCSTGSSQCTNLHPSSSGVGCGTNETCDGTGNCTCASGLTACGGSCIDTQGTDPNNCGACNHACLGGTCAAGVCQPVTVVTSNNAFLQLAVDTTTIYWTDNSDHVLSCPLAGGCGTGKVIYTAPAGDNIPAMTVPAASSPYNAYVYAVTLNQGTDAYLAQINKTTLAFTNTLINTNDPVGAAFDNVNSWVYIADNGSGANDGALERIKPDGTQFGVVLTGMKSPQVVGNPSLDSTFAYISDQGGNAVYFCPLTGSCSLANKALSGLNGPRGLYTDGTNAWATSTGSGVVYACGVGKICGTPTPVAAAQSSPISVVADANYVYWADSGSGQIMRCPLSGCAGSPSVFVASAAGIYPLIQDAAALYWIDNIGIRKVAK